MVFGNWKNSPICLILFISLITLFGSVFSLSLILLLFGSPLFRSLYFALLFTVLLLRFFLLWFLLSSHWKVILSSLPIMALRSSLLNVFLTVSVITVTLCGFFHKHSSIGFVLHYSMNWTIHELQLSDWATLLRHLSTWLVHLSSCML